MSPRLVDRRTLVRSAIAGAAAATVPALPAPTEAAPAAPHDFELYGLVNRPDGRQAAIHLDVVDGVGTIRHRTSEVGRPVTIDPTFASELLRLADHA